MISPAQRYETKRIEVNGISLNIDAVDVVRYVVGNREPYLTVAD